MEERTEYRVVWTTKQLADASGLTISYIRRLLRKGDIKGEHFGRDWAILDSEARRWLAQLENDNK